MKTWKILLVLVVLGIGIFAKINYLRIVDLFSHQNPINPSVLTGEFQSNCPIAYCEGSEIAAPTEIPPIIPTSTPMILPPPIEIIKRIEVDLTNQRLYGFENDKKVFDFLISSGKWHPTPTGTFKIWIKLRYTRMSGGSKVLNTYYDLPNVPYTMFFAGENIRREDGYALHGTYWHNNFGHPMSHGCVNMKTEEVGQLYYWALPDLKGKQNINATTDNPGTEIKIYGVAPKD